MEYFNYKNFTPSYPVVWLCTKQNRLSQYLVDQFKIQLTPEYFEDGNPKAYFREAFVRLHHSTSVVDLEELWKEPPFIGDKYLIQGDFSELESKVQRKLLKLLATNCKHIVAILHISNYADYRKLADNKNATNIGKFVYLYRIPQSLYYDYTRFYIKNEISDQAIRAYLRRTDTLVNYLGYLDILKAFKNPITKEDIVAKIPDCSNYTIDDYIKAILFRDRKTVHLKALNDCLKIYGNKTYDTILDELDKLICVKQLMLKGYLLTPINLSEDLAYMEEHKLVPKELEKLSKYRIKSYLEMCSRIGNTELQIIRLCFLNTRPRVHSLYFLSDLLYTRESNKSFLRDICNKKIQI